MMKSWLVALGVVGSLGVGSAMAQSGAELGTLTCKVSDVSNIVVYTTQKFDCRFEKANGEVEGYLGAITKVGVDLSIKNDFTIVWAVLAPTDVANAPKSLAGTYVGGGADVALGVGVGAKVLVGGVENSFTLQPVSVAGITGGGASLGVESFELSPPS